MENNLPKRKHPRAKDYDYSSDGAYFVTICTHNKKCLLSHIVGRGLAPAEIEYTQYGKIAEQQLLLLEKRFPSVGVDRYVIMPNHIHVIFVIDNDKTAGARGSQKHLCFRDKSPRPTIMDVVCAYKSLTTRECKRIKALDRLFQTSFYEHVIRDNRDYEATVDYICNNPSRWQFDKLNPNI